MRNLVFVSRGIGAGIAVAGPRRAGLAAAALAGGAHASRGAGVTHAIDG